MIIVVLHRDRAYCTYKMRWISLPFHLQPAPPWWQKHMAQRSKCCNPHHLITHQSHRKAWWEGKYSGMCTPSAPSTVYVCVCAAICSCLASLHVSVTVMARPRMSAQCESSSEARLQYILLMSFTFIHVCHVSHTHAHAAAEDHFHHERGVSCVLLNNETGWYGLNVLPNMISPDMVNTCNATC